MVALPEAFKVGVSGALVLFFAFVLGQIVRLALCYSRAQVFFIPCKEHLPHP